MFGFLYFPSLSNNRVAVSKKCVNSFTSVAQLKENFLHYVFSKRKYQMKSIEKLLCVPYRALRYIPTNAQ